MPPFSLRIIFFNILPRVYRVFQFYFAQPEAGSESRRGDAINARDSGRRLRAAICPSVGEEGPLRSRCPGSGQD